MKKGNRGSKFEDHLNEQLKNIEFTIEYVNVLHRENNELFKKIDKLEKKLKRAKNK